eukprot:CAMPEP_0204831438 /NCGR_PEP_ID=MMETSP1346-20131115/10697_1 /ASSEMBLY_ACC=CAM_ASM_000771 /TAXON_ID=215587 /ORGANISM="Aplanochytrium stocchinoi, Strain GSBS06" /LENGTH=64 /DNA_ID=CAMNT_0051962497 /DNA_START=126 /DNA_END=317 /DNA_ORIENTATION=-
MNFLSLALGGDQANESASGDNNNNNQNNNKTITEGILTPEEIRERRLARFRQAGTEKSNTEVEE